MILSSKMGDTGDPPKEIIVCRDLEDLGRQAADAFVHAADEAVSLRRRFSVSLAGGSTPRTLYRQLASRPFAEKIPWRAVHLFWGDERAVPPDHPESNYRMAYETLIAKVPIPTENIHRMPAERSDVDAATKEYEETLRNFFQPPPGGWPSFDLALLGIGSDGHTASLFPRSPALEEKERWVVAPYVEKLNARRFTLTLPVFNHVRQVHFLAAGKEKTPIIKEIVSKDSLSQEIPARMIRPRGGKRLFFLDREAAGLIDSKENLP